MNGGYPGENNSLLPAAGGEIAAVRGGGMTGGGDPKEINLFGTKITITDPSESSTLTAEHETILTKLNFKDKDDTEKRNLLQAIYNEGCDTNATLDLKSGCSPMRGLVTALAMKLLENMSASTATAATVGDDEGVVISMTIPIDKLSIALGSAAGSSEEVMGNPDTWCVAGDEIIDGMNTLLVTPLKGMKDNLESLKKDLLNNIHKTIMYEEVVAEDRFKAIADSIDKLLEDIRKIQSKTCEPGENAESTVSGNTWISAVGHRDSGNIGNENDAVENNEGASATPHPVQLNPEEEKRREQMGITESPENVIKKYGQPATPVSPPNPLASPPSSTPTGTVLDPIAEGNENGNENENNGSSAVTGVSGISGISGVSPQPGSEVPSNASSLGGGMYRKKRSLPNKTRRRVHFGETPVIKLI